MEKPVIKLRSQKIKIGILGGSFDPAHKGHLKISKEAKKMFNLKSIVWAITKKNPFKNKSKSSLRSRMLFAKKLIAKNIYIKVRFYEKKIDSNKTIDLITYLNKNKKFEIFHYLFRSKSSLTPLELSLISFFISFDASLTSRIARPKPLAISGIFFDPKNITIKSNTTIISGPPINNNILQK